MKKLLVAALFLSFTNLASAELSGVKTRSSLDYFRAINDTEKTVTISVGNFFPTKYTIQPKSSKVIFVSSDNQNIHIVEVK